MERNFSPCSRGISGMEASDHQRGGGGGAWGFASRAFSNAFVGCSDRHGGGNAWPAGLSRASIFFCMHLHAPSMSYLCTCTSFFALPNVGMLPAIFLIRAPTTDQPREGAW